MALACLVASAIGLAVCSTSLLAFVLYVAFAALTERNMQ